MQSLYVKYRPSKFEDVIGQDVTVKILQKQVELKKYKNSFIFAGPSGCGKTTIARIFANEINNHCGEPIEIDAASNNGVDNIRNIISSADTRSLDSEYKIFIIDECHMLSSGAWAALLKTIEETPKYTIFMFCTTEINKVPMTIQNRCQMYFLKRVKVDKIIERLKYICNSESYEFTDEALLHIAKLADGSVRQAISLLDKCKDFSNNINIDNVTSVLGSSNDDTFINLLRAFINKDKGSIINIVDEVYNSGLDLNLFLNMLIAFTLDVCKYSLFRTFNSINISDTYKSNLDELIRIDNSNKYFVYILEKLMSIKKIIKGDTDIKTSLEVYFIQL